MARIARIVIPDFPHHVVQRGNRRQKVFFADNDYEEYLKLLFKQAAKAHLEIISYCLMPNHVHIIAIPNKTDSLARGVGEVHRKYTRMINFREGWRGYLWQGRFSSYVLDEHYLLSATRYILLNPVKAKLVSSPFKYPWSSAKYHLKTEKCAFLNDTLLNSLIDDWKDFLSASVDRKDIDLLKKHETTGRPLGDLKFIEKLEKIIGKSLMKQKPGPKKHN